MSGLFYKLGKVAGPNVRKAKWFWQTATGSEAEAVKAEQQVGQDMAYAVRKKLDFGVEGQIRQLLNDIGSKLSDCTANKRRRFSFEPFKSSNAEAFSLPGGFIFISRELVRLCEFDKNKLAFILGHEMAHVIGGHVTERILSNSAMAIALRPGAPGGAFANVLRKVGMKFLQSAYSQEQEFEADKVGIELAFAAGYDPSASMQLLQRLAKLMGDANKADPGGYFSTHPAFKCRIDNINQLLHR